MKSRGRRMGAKQRMVHDPKEIQKIENMNLGEPQALTFEEIISFRCYDIDGRRLQNVFVAPDGNRICMLYRNACNGIGDACIDTSEQCTILKSRNRSMKHRAKMTETGEEIAKCHRERVTRDRAEFERGDLLYRANRNPGAKIRE